MKLYGTFSYLYSRILHVNKLQECDTVFIMPDSNNWNSQCEYFGKDENAMINFEDEILEDKKNTNYAMEISDDNDMVENYSVSTMNLDKHINSTISSAYAYNPVSMHKHCISNFDKYCANALSLRGGISKMSASIRSCNVSSEDCDLFQSPYVTTLTNFEYNLE